MTRLTAYFHFATQGLTVDSSLLGKQFEVLGNGINSNSVFIRLPKDNDDFWLKDFAPRDYDDLLIGATAGTKDNPKEKAQILVIQVGVRFTVKFKIPPHTTDMRILSKLFPYLKAMSLQAESVAKGYLDTVAVYGGQPWVGSRTDIPELVHLTQVFDSEGNRIRVGYSSPITVSFPSWELALTEERQVDVLKKLKTGSELPLAENFLRDARYISSKNGDPAQAILFLAIACEVKIKTHLTDIAKVQQKELLKLIINRPPVVALFDKTAKAICGRSLLEENKKLYDKVDLLFKDRNQIAHHGIVPTSKKAQGHITTSIEAFEWLESF